MEKAVLDPWRKANQRPGLRLGETVALRFVTSRRIEPFAPESS